MFFKNVNWATGETLREIYQAHRGRVADKWDGYFDCYDFEFSRYRDMPVTILELGVQNGGSLETWSKYFKSAKAIIGVDIVEQVESYSYSDVRIKTICGDATSIYDNARLIGVTPSIIVDDASHQSFDIISSFVSLFPRLESGGVYVVEDLCCSYWRSFNVQGQVSSWDFFKALSDLVNYEHMSDECRSEIVEWLSDSNITKIPGFDFQSLLSIQSIRFYNSMCFISKGSSKGSIGKRCVVGDDAPLGFRAPDGQDVSEVKRQSL